MRRRTKSVASVTFRPTDEARGAGPGSGIDGPHSGGSHGSRGHTERTAVDRGRTERVSTADGGSIAPDADRFVMAVAVDGEVLFAGPSMPGVIGVEREAVTGDDLLEYVHPNDRDSVADALSAVATDRTVTHRVRHANGGFVWVESVVDEELAPEFGGRVVTARRVDVDKELPERFRRFLEYGTDLVTVVDADGRVRYESPSIEEVLGYEQGSTVGRSPLGYVHPDDRERVTERFYHALSDPDAAPTLEYRYRTADGDWVWLESQTRSLPGDGVGGRLLLNSRDVSDRKARERRLTDRNERLDRFASIVSHDLRNPLSVIRASMEMARLKDDTTPLARGERAVDRIDQLVTELLTLARQGSGIDEPTEFTLDGVVRDAWGTAGSPDATLLVAADARVRGDRGRLRQAFENLFRNCIEHGTPDDPTARTDLTVVVAATEAGFLVADDGPGVDPDHHERVFEPGVTTREDGTGYGLDIVREIVESHGWEVTLRDDAVDIGGLAIEDTGVDGEHAPNTDGKIDGACFEVHAPDPETAAEADLWIGQ